MDPSYIRSAPGKSPMGMDLVPECGASARAGDATAEAGEVRIDTSLVQKIGVKTAAVAPRASRRHVR